ncbi:MAG: Ig domain-containing protein [Myxococcota bacterium]|nr:Ig domain-containing protein [Myxococcota bacterium]
MIPRSRKLGFLIFPKFSSAAVAGMACGFFLALIVGCTSETTSDSVKRAEQDAPEMASVDREPSGGPPQIQSLHLVPPRPRPDELVQARVKVKKADEESAVDLDFEWSLAGDRVRARSEAVRFPGARKGDRIEVRVRATDPQGLTSEATAFARIGNQPPSLLGVELSRGSRSGSGSVLETSVQTHDPDGDDLRLIYEWRVNGRRVPGRLSSLDTGDLRRGDEVQVVVIADDGDDHSEQGVSEVVRVENSAPRITSNPNNKSSNGSFFYQVEADDPDLDRGLIYSLVEAPKGMTIGRLGGELTWSPGPKQGGVHAVTIRVEDRHGGSALQTFELTIHDHESSQELASARN